MSKPAETDTRERELSWGRREKPGLAGHLGWGGCLLSCWSPIIFSAALQKGKQPPHVATLSQVESVSVPYNTKSSLWYVFVLDRKGQRIEGGTLGCGGPLRCQIPLFFNSVLVLWVDPPLKAFKIKGREGCSERCLVRPVALW